MKVYAKVNNYWVVDGEKYYFRDAKDLVWNLYSEKFITYEDADKEFNSIRSWPDLENFASRFGAFYVEK
ncbi:hypothetical protein QYC35_07320 [Ligilactobacillus salivarius]|uniref:Phage protein n=1 Tax=Ligilactobacillus salivarius TaxID=1624 RepID=A0AAW7N8B2_9LACO|nr:hypothetical protein [Ligilactobacillus salivarius]MDN4834007.1 hypothetical protein [Ligilactobacillus salivarius]